MNRGSGGGTGGGGGSGGGGGVFDKSVANTAKSTGETPTASKKATHQAGKGAGVAAATAAAAAATTAARPSFLKRAVKPFSSTDHKTPRARAGTTLKNQALRRDPRGRIIYRGSQDFESAGAGRGPVPVVEPPPGRLVGNGDRIARPREKPFIGKERTLHSNVGAGRRIAGQPGRSSNGGDAGSGARDSLRDSPRDGGRRAAAGAGEPPESKRGVSVTSVERVAAVVGENVATRQQRGITPPQDEKRSTRIGGGRGAGKGAHGSTTALTAIPSDRAATRVAVNKNHAPPEVETRQEREHAQERDRERERDGVDASEAEAEEEHQAQPHKRDVLEDEGDYGRRETDQNCSDTENDVTPLAAAGSGDVGEVARLKPPPDQLHYEKEVMAEDPAATGLGSIVAPSGGG